MVWFGILDCLIFLSWSSPVLLVADVPMVHTTLPKVEKVDMSSTEVPMAQALVAQMESKTPDDDFVDDDPGFLNFTAVGSETVCRMSPRL
jgi:hypothetical protein